MSKSYIGITDFTTYAQVEHMLSVFNQTVLADEYRLHVGVMMSHKTLNDIPTSWSKAFPKKEDIASIFASGQTMNCLHYADYDEISVANNLAKAIHYGGDGINALQLDMHWPDPTDVFKAVRGSGKKLEVILQVGKKAFQEADGRPSFVVEKLMKYVGIANYILLDTSMGKGESVNAEAMVPFVEAIKQKFDFNVSVAGGLGPTTTHLVDPLLAKFVALSFDAQSKLRTSGDAHDPLEWNMGAEYLVRIAERVWRYRSAANLTRAVL